MLHCIVSRNLSTASRRITIERRSKHITNLLGAKNRYLKSDQKSLIVGRLSKEPYGQLLLRGNYVRTPGGCAGIGLDWVDGLMDEWMEGWLARWVDRWTDGLID